jgi:putative aldouronate transport system substrate-binding protein
LVFTLVASMLGGCASKAPATTAPAGQATTGATATPAPEPTPLKIMTQSDPRTIDCATMPMWQNIENEANVKIEWDQVRSGWEEKKALVLASNALPDIFLGGLTDGDITTNIKSFVELTDLIKQYAPNVTKMFEENPGALAISTIPGAGIYSLPLALGFMPRSSATLMINKTWLDKLNVPVPTTIGELEAALVAFRDGDPNGNNQKDEIPLDWPSEIPGYVISPHSIYVLTGAYGTVDYSNVDNIVVKDGKVSFLWTSEAYYKLQQALHKWFTENLINPEVFTNTYAAAAALSTQGEAPRVGVTVGWSPASRTGQFADQYIVLPQLKESADSTVKPLWPSSLQNMSFAPNCCEMTIACKEQEAAMKLINLFYTDDWTIQSYYGSFPDNVLKNDDGTYEILMPKDGSTVESNKWLNALCNYAPGYFSADLEKRTKAPQEVMERINQDNVYADNRPANKDIFPSIVKFDAGTTEEMVYLKTDIYKLASQKMAEWVVNGGIEDQWDAYLESLNRMGLPRLIEIYQKAYDTYHID